jgi:N-acetylneuraminic acid mutarotase
MNVFQDFLIVFGGFDGKRWLSDLHKFDTQTLMWSQQNMQGDPPQPRQYHAASIIGSNLYIYGGFNGSYWLSDLVVVDIQEGRWNYPITYGNQPCAKEGLAMAAVETYLFVHGGWNGITNSDLHRFDTLKNEWTLVQIEGKKPALCGHSITRVNDKLFVFGGYDGTKWANSLYILDPLKDKTWTEPNVFGVPMARGYHSAVLYNKYILVFAGFNGSDVLNDIVALDIETLTWFLPDTCSGYFPQARNAHSMVLHGSQLYLFGGYNGSRDTNELYILETSAFSSLHEDLKSAYTNSSWHDAVLYSSSGSIHVHSVILKSRAPLLFCRLIDNNPSFILRVFIL